MSTTFGIAQAMFFANPLTPSVAPKQIILHSDTRNGFEAHRRGQIVDVKPQRIFTDNRMFYTTTDGYYVDGVPVIGPSETGPYQSVIVLDYDEPFLGVVEASGNRDYALVRETQSRAGKSSVSRRFPAKKMIRPAEWAEEFWPRHYEDDSMTNLRCDAARMRFRREYAEAVIIAESEARGWNDDLEDLNYPMPTPYWSAYVSGMLFVSTGESLDRLEDRERFDGLGVRSEVMVGVPCAGVASSVFESSADRAKATAMASSNLRTMTNEAREIRSKGMVVESASVDTAYPLVASVRR